MFFEDPGEILGASVTHLRGDDVDRHISPPEQYFGILQPDMG